MPDKWYTNYMTELKQTPVGCHMVIAAEDIRNRVRALEKASATALASVPSVTYRVSLVHPSGGRSILTGTSAERQPNAASTTALMISQVSVQVDHIAFLNGAPPSRDAGERTWEGALATVVVSHATADNGNGHSPLWQSYA